MTSPIIYAVESQTSVLDLGKTTVVGKANKKTTEETVKKQGLHVDVIDTSEYKNSTRSIKKILTTKSGVNIRQSGGLGSESKVSLNGISGNRVRYFLDGVPVENFGSSSNILNLPANLVESIEVYKGVVPINFGADALGGAINLKTSNTLENYLDVSHSYGSFDTHRFALNGQYVTESDNFARLSSYVNDTKNNYTMYGVPQEDNFGNFLGNIDAKRFHDDFHEKMIALEAGVANKNYADKLSVKVQFADNKNNMQHPNHSINRIFGELYTENESWKVSTHYQKDWSDFSLNAYLLKGFSEDRFSDKAGKRYDWNGNFSVKTDEKQGELSTKSLFVIEDDILKGSLFGQYHITPRHHVNLNYTYNQVKRDAEDKVNQVNTSFTEPNELNKSVMGVAYQWKSKAKKTSINNGSNGSANSVSKTQDSRAQATLFYKHYNYNADLRTPEYREGGVIIIPRDINKEKQGYGAYGSYQLTPALQVNGSYERAYRLPEAYEVLGDGEKYVRANPLLEPEESDNINLGLLASKTWQLASEKKLEVTAEANGFYRKARDYIQFYPDRVVQGEYRNLNDVTVEGVELSASANYDKTYSISANVTSQTLTDKSRLTPNGLTNNAFDTDVAYEPKLFADMRLGYQADISESWLLTSFWNTHYVDEFPLLEGQLGSSDSKNIVPSQLSHDLELIFSKYEVLNDMDGMHLSLLFENMTDERLYDNYRIQKPGRAYYAKLRYEF